MVPQRLPLRDVGILELNRNPDNFFAEIEQAAFNPTNIVDGIGFSPTKCSRDGYSHMATPSVTASA